MSVAQREQLRPDAILGVAMTYYVRVTDDLTGELVNGDDFAAPTATASKPEAHTSYVVPTASWLAQVGDTRGVLKVAFSAAQIDTEETWWLDVRLTPTGGVAEPIDRRYQFFVGPKGTFA